MFEIAQIPLTDDMEIEVRILNEEDEPEGALYGFTVNYESGTELQIKIVENAIE